MPIRPRDPSPSSSSTSSASSSTSFSPSSSPSSSSSVPAYELCTTRRHVQRALSILSQYPLVVLDCEGAALGNAGGALSLLCLGTPVAGPTQHIFLFDMPALAPDPRARGLLASFLERGPVQVVWDGRMDSIEIYAALGIGLTRVLDLQVAEVVARGALLGEGDAEREERLARHKFGWKFVEDNRATMRGLHVVRGLQNCIEFYHPDLRVEKDPVVVEMHQSGESHKWLERPMPDHLQSYAASDIALIAHLLSIFDTLGFFADPLGPEIMSRSARYVSRTTRIAKDDPLPPCAVLMLDALGVIRCGGSCVRCGMELPVSCFERWRAKGAEMRRVHCRLCVVLSLRAGSALDSDWISLPPIPRSSPRRRSRALKASACAFSVQQPEQVARPFIPLMQPVYY